MVPNRSARHLLQQARRSTPKLSTKLLINVTIVLLMLLFAIVNFFSRPEIASREISTTPPVQDKAIEIQEPLITLKASIEHISNSVSPSSPPLKQITYGNSSLPLAAYETISILKKHPMHRFASSLPLDEIVHGLYTSESCGGRPVFMGMASVGSHFYRQMVENFVYTMVKFNLSDCTLLICVTDPTCMDLCRRSSFPCYDFQYHLYHDSSVPKSTMEQIALLKLFHVPKALHRGVDVFTVDLDVGFLDDPMLLVKDRIRYPHVDIFVQMDISFVMNRTVAGWRTWYTQRMPNIGLMLVRGNSKTVRMFQRAYTDYGTMKEALRNQPGKDQNKVADAMRYATAFYGLKWKFFSPDMAVLADKIYKFENKTIELGGEASSAIYKSKGAISVHVTCYEFVNKVMGLKAANAFWNPFYYDPTRRTITKKLLFLSEKQLQNEVRALIWLAIETNRSLILPNALARANIGTVDLHRSAALWPGFRLAFVTAGVQVDIIEPAFYWRIRRDYSRLIRGEEIVKIPDPHVISMSETETLSTVLKAVSESKEPRIILQMVKPAQMKLIASPGNPAYEHIREWADDSVGAWRPYQVEWREYGQLSSGVDELRWYTLNSMKGQYTGSFFMENVRICKKVFAPMRGNRSCFDKCD